MKKKKSLFSFVFVQVIIKLLFHDFFFLSFNLIFFFQNLRKLFSQFLSYRKLMSFLNRLPNVTQEELENADTTCLICREDMTPFNEPKRLPCRHIFHFQCLKAWFQRSRVGFYWLDLCCLFLFSFQFSFLFLSFF